MTLVSFNSNLAVLDATRPEEPASRHGLALCDFDEFAHKNPHRENIVNICPWHWALLERPSRYPFSVPVAVCNCVKCHASTSFDTSKLTNSRCTSNFEVRPVVYREQTLDLERREQEFWFFGLERLAVSCSCSVKIQLFK